MQLQLINLSLLARLEATSKTPAEEMSGPLRTPSEDVSNLK